MLTDIDGNTYRIIKIGNQWWTAENLKVTHYRNGDVIHHVTDSTEWSQLKTGAYCEYDNNPANAKIYGRLYNWYAVNDSRNIAPEGWHVPSDEEWKELEIYLGISQSDADEGGYRGTDQGSQLAGNADLWVDGDLEDNAAFGSSGFAALPGRTAAAMVTSAIWVASPISGHTRSTIVALRGPGHCSTASQASSGAAPISRPVIRFVW